MLLIFLDHHLLFVADKDGSASGLHVARAVSPPVTCHGIPIVVTTIGAVACTGAKRSDPRTPTTSWTVWIVVTKVHTDEVPRVTAIFELATNDVTVVGTTSTVVAEEAESGSWVFGHVVIMEASAVPVDPVTDVMSVISGDGDVIRGKKLTVVTNTATLGNFHEAQGGPRMSPANGLPLSGTGILCSPPAGADGSHHDVAEILSRVRRGHRIFPVDGEMLSEDFPVSEILQVISVEIKAIPGTPLPVCGADISSGHFEGHSPSTAVFEVLSSVTPPWVSEGGVITA